jgi:hypothetical protein
MGVAVSGEITGEPRRLLLHTMRPNVSPVPRAAPGPRDCRVDGRGAPRCGGPAAGGR